MCQQDPRQQGAGWDVLVGFVFAALTFLMAWRLVFGK
jgi:hypothetical protein